MPKILIFDFDGTIVDSMNEFADIASKVLNKHFGTPVETARNQYFETSGLPFFEQVELLHPKDPKNAVAVDEYETEKKVNYLSHKAFAEVPAAISQIREAGVKTVVSSNNFQELVDRLVERIGIEFDMVLGWRENFAKGPEHFEHARKSFGCDKIDMIFVGDSLKDFDRALDYGIGFIGKTGTFSKDDFLRHNNGIKTIDSLSDLAALVRKER